MADKPICGESTSRLFHGCGKPVWKERPNDGRSKIHHPDTIRAQRDARAPRWKLESHERDARLDMQDAERELMAYLVGPPEKPLASMPCGADYFASVEERAAKVIYARATHRDALRRLRDFDLKLKLKKGVTP